MGFRTVVVLYNDQAGEWQNDPALGKKIAIGMNCVADKTLHSPADLKYGYVVESVHADQQTLAVFDSYNMQTIATGQWSSEQTSTQVQEKLVRAAAEKLGFTLTRKSLKANMGWTGSDDVAR